MNSVIIGVALGLLVIVSVGLLKQLDKPTVYGLVLSGIGFLYVGFTWTDIPSFVINCLQAVFFLLISYYGIKKSLYLLAAGYFLHGLWDLAYPFFPGSNLIPPHYDLFCLSVDFTIGFYLLVMKYQQIKRSERTVPQIS